MLTFSFGSQQSWIVSFVCAKGGTRQHALIFPSA